MPKVLITSFVPDEQISPLLGVADISFGTDSNALMPREKVLEIIEDFDAVLNGGELKVNAELLDAGEKLKIICNSAIGYDNFDTTLMTAHKVWGCNAPDSFTEATADATLGILLGLVRRIVEGDRFVRAGKWKSFEPGRWDGMLLQGKTIGIVGYGNIGKAVARRAKACLMNVVYHRRQAQPEDPEYRTLEQLLKESDVVSLHTPLTPDTYRLINAERIAMMKKGAILINMARGKVCDESAIVKALDAGHLAGAGLDVFENEPQVHPALPFLENVVIPPHVGGGTRESRKSSRLLGAQNIALVLQGKRPLSPVNQI